MSGSICAMFAAVCAGANTSRNLRKSSSSSYVDYDSLLCKCPCGKQPKLKYNHSVTAGKGFVYVECECGLRSKKFISKDYFQNVELRMDAVKWWNDLFRSKR